MKYRGTKKVKVYAIPAPKVPGGTMIASGGYLGVFRQSDNLFYFDETQPSGHIMRHRVNNVSKTGIYRKNQLTAY